MATAALVAAAPKCPLCLLPIAAALGIGLPTSSRLLTGLIVLTIVIAVATLARMAPWRYAAAAAGGAALALTGRAIEAPILLGCGAAVMMVASFLAARRPRCQFRASCPAAMTSGETPDAGERDARRQRWLA